MGRSSLAQRISLLAVGVAVITALVAGVLSVSLTRSVNESAARKTLSNLADAVAANAELGTNARAAEVRVARTLRAVRVQYALVDSAGTVTGSTKLARTALTAGDISRVMAGASLSLRRTVSGKNVLIEARPARGGAVVLVQARSDALAASDQAVRRVLLALLIAVAIAAALGLLVAFRIARPLRRTAAAARALAAGRRDVAVQPQGPAEVAEVGAAVNTLASALSHSEARQREFLLSVSHDLRTPLTAITGYAESLADGVVPAQETSRVGTVMLSESRRLNRLVADLLDLARLDTYEFRIDVADADLGGMARDAAAVWATRCAAAGVRFTAEIPPHPVWARTDANRLRQALDGLLDNALRVTPADAVIVLAVRNEPGLAVAEVRDGGPGLLDADLPVAFERSVLYDRYRAVRQSGTGLGLAIVQGLVRRLGGTVEAGHAVEGGARFTIRLPVG